MRLYLNGAFFNDGALNSSAVLASDYEGAQRAVVDRLVDQGCTGWGHDQVVKDPKALSFGVNGKYSTLIPVSFARRSGDELLDRMRRIVNDVCASADLGSRFDGTEIHVEDADIDFFDFGVGVLAIMLALRPRRPLSLEELRTVSEGLSTALVAR